MGATTMAERPEPRLRSELPDPKLGLGETAKRLATIALLIGPAFVFDLAPEGSLIWRGAPLLTSLWLVGLLVFAAVNAERLGVRRAAVTYALLPLVSLVAVPMLAWRVASLHDPYWTGTVYPVGWKWWHKVGAVLGAVTAVAMLINGAIESFGERARSDGYVVRSGDQLRGGIVDSPPVLNGGFMNIGDEVASDGESVWLATDLERPAVQRVGSDVLTPLPSPALGLAAVGDHLWAVGGGQPSSNSFDESAGWVARINKATGTIEGYLRLEEGHPTDAIAVDGELWVSTADGSVWRLDPVRSRWISRTVLPERSRDTAHRSSGFGVTENLVWVGTDALYGIDRQSGEIERRIEVTCCIVDVGGWANGVLIFGQELGDDDLTGTQRFAMLDVESGQFTPLDLAARSQLVVPSIVGAGLYVDHVDGNAHVHRIERHGGRADLASEPDIAGAAGFLAAVQVGDRVQGILHVERGKPTLVDLGPVLDFAPDR